MSMLGLLFPRVIDNRFRGQRLGYWLMAPVLVLKIGIAVASILTPREANKADAINVSTYSEPALRHAMTSTALLGLLHLCIGLICLLAMIRYRAMVPLVYLWLLVEFLGRRVIFELYPIARVHSPSRRSIVNLALLAMLPLGFALALVPPP